MNDHVAEPFRSILNGLVGVMRACPSPNPSECAMIRERLVAGVNAPIPDCPIHGAWSDEAAR
jgi:hypothetical protein